MATSVSSARLRIKSLLYIMKLVTALLLCAGKGNKSRKTKAAVRSLNAIRKSGCLPVVVLLSSREIVLRQTQTYSDRSCCEPAHGRFVSVDTLSEVNRAELPYFSTASSQS